MFLKQLSLQNFRNLKNQSFEFNPGVTVIVGPNTSGKTNLLEAIYLLATGKSFRAEIEEEVIAYGEGISRINGVTNFSSLSNRINSVTPELTKLEVAITAGQVAGKKAPKKQFLVNGVKKRAINFLGNFHAVLFSPQDLQLITDSPSLRRKYLDSVLVSVDKEYRRALLVYEKALRQRNRVLERIRDRQANSSQLDYWNKLLIENGQVISEKREELIEFINSQYGVCHPDPELDSGDSGSIGIPKSKILNQVQDMVRNDRKFVGSDKEIFENFKIVYEKNEISETRLEEKRDKEILLGMTLVGPHRDDFVVTQHATRNTQHAKERDLSVYGSRGEQRLAVLWLKLGELAFLEEKTGQKPILLLDDIFSELDKDHRHLVTQIIPNQQTIITTTEKEVVKREFLKEAKIIEL